MLDRPGAEAGFSLLELLVALAILGLITAALASALNGAARLWRSGEAGGDGLQRVTVAEGLLRRQIEGALAVSLPAQGGARLAFEGLPRTLLFVARRPARLGAAGLYLAELRLENAGGGRSLVARWTPLDRRRPIALQGPPSASVALLDDVRDAAFSYYDAPAGGGGGVWRRRWSDPDRLPSLVRLDLTPAAGATWRWPGFVVAPRPAVARAMRRRRAPAERRPRLGKTGPAWLS